jgi:NAD(P)H-flavin reductase
MPEPKKSTLALDSARGLGVDVRRLVARSTIGSPPATARRASDPELDWLLGSIRERRGAQVARAQAASLALARRAPNAPPSPATAPPVGNAEPGVVLDVRSVSPSVRIFRVAKPNDFAFRAGQAIKLGLSSVRRSYSIASAPSDPHLEFCIEAVPGGRFTSQLFELAPGEQIALGPKAKGDLTLRADRRQHVMVATVTGIAPLRSMLRDALQAGAGRGGAAAESEFWVLHGASYADELPYADELAALAREDRRVHYLPTVSRPGAARNRGWAGHLGRVETLLMPTLQATRSKADVAVYACGHPEMVRGVRERVSALGYLVLDEAFD